MPISYITLGFRPVRDHVAKSLRAEGFSIERADEIFGTEPIIEDIWEAINSASLIVADDRRRTTSLDASGDSLFVTCFIPATAACHRAAASTQPLDGIAPSYAEHSFYKVLTPRQS